jgi:hypothetical protein
MIRLLLAKQSSVASYLGRPVRGRLSRNAQRVPGTNSGSAEAIPALSSRIAARTAPGDIAITAEVPNSHSQRELVV